MSSRTWKELDAITGGLSDPSKMPCKGYSLPARYCHTGSLHRTDSRKVCSRCYACKCRFVCPGVQAAMERRFRAVLAALMYTVDAEEWYLAMVESIRKTGDGHFRWHDSGDIQSPDHLFLIARVARATPRVKHWVPTQEVGMLRAYFEKFRLMPRNLTVRVTAPIIDSCDCASLGQPIAAVYRDPMTVKDRPNTWLCPASMKRTKDGSCGQCRACWDAVRTTVVYKLH